MITITRMTKTEPAYVPPKWSTGTDAGILEALEKHYSGEINLHDYWSVGDKRTVHLDAVDGDTSLPLAYGVNLPAQDVTLVLLDAGGKELVRPIEGKAECAFIVGVQRTLITGSGYGSCDIWDEAHETNSGGWDACPRRTWMNSVIIQALPSTIRSAFKQFKNITADGNTATAITSNDYFALPSIMEVYGSVTYSGVTYANATVENQNHQFEYWETTANQQYLVRDDMWFRTPSNKNGTSTDFCYMNSDMSISRHNAYMPFAIAPFGVI